MNKPIPVLTIDGPSGAGKGTVSRAVARALGWNFLDSGAIYRALALAVARAGIDPGDTPRVAALAEALDLRFPVADPPRVLLNGQDVTDEIHTESCGKAASQVAANAAVRQALLGRQREFRRFPGLVADGRDMGTVVFPDAEFKVFLTASAEIRATRRYNQLIAKGIDVSLASLAQEIQERDLRDSERAHAPLVAAEGAVMIDSSDLSIDEVVASTLRVLNR